MRNNRDLNHLVSNPPSVQVNIYKVHVTQHASTKDIIPEGEFEYSLYLLVMSHMSGEFEYSLYLLVMSRVAGGVWIFLVFTGNESYGRWEVEYSLYLLGMSHVAGGRLNIPCIYWEWVMWQVGGWIFLVFTGNELYGRWEVEYSLYLLGMSRVAGGRLNIPCIYW